MLGGCVASGTQVGAVVGRRLRWTDVLVDFGEVTRSSFVDVEFCGLKPWRGGSLRVSAVSGGIDDASSPRWTCGAGGPFSKAFDVQLSILGAYEPLWVYGAPLLVDLWETLDPNDNTTEDWLWAIQDGRLEWWPVESKSQFFAPASPVLPAEIERDSCGHGIPWSDTILHSYSTLQEQWAGYSTADFTLFPRL